MSTNNMTRAEAYSAIKSMGLQKECVKRFGKNFTMCKTADLIALIDEKSAPKPVPSTPTKKEKIDEAKKGETKKQIDTTKCVDIKVRSAFSKLLTILTDNGTLDDDEVEEIESILDGIQVATFEDYHSSFASPYSDDEIDEMFDFEN